MAFGSFEGLTRAVLQKQFPKDYAAWLDNPRDVAPPGGETTQLVADRAMSAVARIRDRTRRGPVLISSHKTTLRALLCALLGIDLRFFQVRLGQPLGGLSCVELRRTGPILTLLGDTSYLPAQLRELEGS